MATLGVEENMKFDLDKHTKYIWLYRSSLPIYKVNILFVFKISKNKSLLYFVSVIFNAEDINTESSPGCDSLS